MPPTLTYPGVYIEEVPSGVRTIAGVATSITAFIGRALRGPTNFPVRIQSFAEFERRFGGLWSESTLGYSVSHYFLNGGTDALVVRVQNGGAAATLTIGADFNLIAASEGLWGERLRVRIDHETRPALPGEAADSLFNLTVRDTGTNVTERFLNLSTDPTNARFVTRVLEQQSNLVRIADPGTVNATRPVAHGAPPAGADPLLDDASSTAFDTDGDDGGDLTEAQISDPGLAADKEGLWALEHADLFNLLCIPPLTRLPGDDIGAQTRTAAAAYCRDRRALFIVDPLSAWDEVSDVTGADGVDSATFGLARSENAALFFPMVRMSDPLKEGRLESFAPSGAVAGVFARTDATRGVWKAPAGIEATLNGAAELSVKLTDGENGQLNPLGVNCLRAFPVIGRVVWGSRTWRGADQLASEWKYIPVRRLALFLEESLYRGTQWVVFEPNDEPLWAQIRLNVGAFMQNLFRQGAFQGRTPREAYFVKCDKDTTTQNDINLGIVNIVVGFAPLKPAEFVVVKIQQMAGQIEA